MGFWAPVAAAAVGGLTSSLGGKKGNKAARKSSEYQRHLATPTGAKDWIGQVNPYFHGAFYDQQRGNTGLQQAWYDLFMNPGQSSNWPYTQGMQGINNSFLAAQGKLGRANFGALPGLQQAYAMANQASKNQLGQQFGFMRDQRMRDDLQLINNLLGQQIGMVQGTPHPTNVPFTPNAMSGVGNAIGAGLAAYGGYQQNKAWSDYLSKIAPGGGGDGAPPPPASVNTGALYNNYQLGSSPPQQFSGGLTAPTWPPK